MAERLLLVDFENVQAVDLTALPGDIRVRLVLGARQTKLPSALAMQAHALGERFAYVPIQGQQPNAVDFCIAFYLGEYLAINPEAECVILSKDKKGFDPLVRHLTAERGYRVRRVDAQKEAFPVRSAKPEGDPFARLLELLGKDPARPLKRKGLDGKLKSWFAQLSADDRGKLLQRLFDEEFVSESDGALTYRLPSLAADQVTSTQSLR